MLINVAVSLCLLVHTASYSSVLFFDFFLLLYIASKLVQEVVDNTSKKCYAYKIIYALVYALT